MPWTAYSWEFWDAEALLRGLSRLVMPGKFRQCRHCSDFFWVACLCFFLLCIASGHLLTLNMVQVSQNFDDITDINSPPSWGFMQQDPRTFYMCDVNGDPLPTGQEMQLYTYPDLAPIGSAIIVSAAVCGL